MKKSRLLFAALGLLAASAHSQGYTVSSPIEFARKAATLKPGQWVWAPEVSPNGPVLVYADLSRQIATVYRNGVRIAVTTISSGKPGHETPTGVFTILEKDAKHHSSTYNNAAMPYQQRLTWGGVALHAGGLPGYPESHGCVHLPFEFSKRLFATTSMGGTVIVGGAAGEVSTEPEAGVLAPHMPSGARAERRLLADGETFRWQPHLSPSGPVSIIVSRLDKRVIVLRNGIEIGRSRAEIADQKSDIHVYTYIGEVGGERRWMVAGVARGQAAPPVKPWLAEGIDIPPAFLANVRSILTPGASMLVTRSRVLPSTSGRQMTVLDSGPRA
ncbi:L,D-transpeptidase family protein [Sphingomonas sp. ASV193]|uniref:L,D-transpeptidase family protein n=1 Tax=Sphingomonas sp. ASV193 TaxID=3144405 RepID=UPI0032E8DE77